MSNYNPFLVNTQPLNNNFANNDPFKNININNNNTQGISSSVNPFISQNLPSSNTININQFASFIKDNNNNNNNAFPILNKENKNENKNIFTFTSPSLNTKPSENKVNSSVNEKNENPFIPLNNKTSGINDTKSSFNIFTSQNNNNENNNPFISNVSNNIFLNNSNNFSFSNKNDKSDIDNLNKNTNDGNDSNNIDLKDPFKLNTKKMKVILCLIIIILIILQQFLQMCLQKMKIR